MRIAYGIGVRDLPAVCGGQAWRQPVCAWADEVPGEPAAGLHAPWGGPRGAGLRLGPPALGKGRKITHLPYPQLPTHRYIARDEFQSNK
eukprot:scaffold467771_cov38-Prasinocladus_malaysianus.AAC.1